ncbi:reverse transcriptase domain-containing protein [Moellerella wisconsensis]|uniref:reverse transcriptase domain-containing protein n=1 Tax=Moellerella wisconsensis TaxID=158849 RepID=UPI00307652CE
MSLLVWSLTTHRKNMTAYQNRWLHKFELKKDRWIYVPSLEERNKGLAFLDDLHLKWSPPLYYYHLRNGGHIAALKVHLDNQYFAHIDLKNFFNSTSRSRVTRVLKEFYPYEQAREIAKFSTVKNLVNSSPMHIVPFGFVQSPMLATLCLHKSYLGDKVRELFNKKDIKISIYMDDIVISSSEKNILTEIYSNLVKYIQRSHYLINETKSQSPAEKIVVFNIYLSPNKLKITEDRIFEFLLNYTRTKSPKVKEGIKSYVQTVNILQSKIFV